MHTIGLLSVISNSLLMQWGTDNEIGSTGKQCNFPIAYNTCWNVNTGKWYNNDVFGTTPCNVGKTYITKTGFWWGSYQGVSGYGIFYLAIGI